jgi:hypothetical protein
MQIPSENSENKKISEILNFISEDNFSEEELIQKILELNSEEFKNLLNYRNADIAAEIITYYENIKDKISEEEFIDLYIKN